VDLALGRELAQREGAVATVGGEVSEVGGRVLFLARIVDPTSGEDLGSLRETARDSGDVLEAIDRLSRGVRQKLGESARTLKASPALARATTTSVEALRKYTQALTLKEDGATIDQAQTLLEEAVRQDSGFALAWRTLYDLRPTGSGRWEALQHAMANRERLSPAERAFTEATYADYVGNYPDQVAALRTVVRLDPGNATAWGSLADVLLVRMADDEGALDAARRALDASGHAPGRFLPVINYELASRHPDVARRVLDSLRQTAPKSPDAILAAIAWHSHFGEYAVAESLAVAADGEGNQSAGWAPIRRNLLLLQGRPTEAEAQQRRFVQTLTQQGRPETALWAEFAYAQLLSRVEGVSPGIQRRLEEALRRWPPQKMNPLDPGYIPMASSAAWSGRPALARELLAKWVAVQPTPVIKDSLGIYWVLGDIALAERRYADAARFMGRAGDITPGAENYYPHRGHPHDLLGNVDSAIVLYQSYLSRVTDLGSRLYWLDPAHLSETYEALGRNFELRGQADSSAKYYQALLDMWKNAEPSLEPKKAAIRQALARVTAEKPSP
jgi:tetratricopeptide (TPR) repeat protein